MRSTRWGSKRGSHLSLSLERLDLLTDRPAQRIGLSATVTPLQTIADYLHPGHDVQIVAPPRPLTSTCNCGFRFPDMTTFAEPAEGQPRRASIWPAVENSILDLVETHTSTIVFTNSGGSASACPAVLNELAADEQASDEVPAQVMGHCGVAQNPATIVARAHHGSVSKSRTGGDRGRLESGKLPAVVATSSLELGIDTGSIDLMVQVGCPRRSPPACSVSARRTPAGCGQQRSSPPTAAICSPPRSPSTDAACGDR